MTEPFNPQSEKEKDSLVWVLFAKTVCLPGKRNCGSNLFNFYPGFWGRSRTSLVTRKMLSKARKIPTFIEGYYVRCCADLRDLILCNLNSNPHFKDDETEEAGKGYRPAFKLGLCAIK